MICYLVWYNVGGLECTVREKWKQSPAWPLMPAPQQSQQVLCPAVNNDFLLISSTRYSIIDDAADSPVIVDGKGESIKAWLAGQTSKRAKLIRQGNQPTGTMAVS